MEGLYSEQEQIICGYGGKGDYVGTNAGGVGGVYLIIASVFSVKKEARSSVHSDLLILQATLQ